MTEPFPQPVLAMPFSWPHTGHHRPEDVSDHAAQIKADFAGVSHAVDISLSRKTRLPSELLHKISLGITKGIAEACPKWSDTDKGLFSKVILKNITTEATMEARDRVPLPQFRGLHESYNTLHSKLTTQLRPTTPRHQSIGAGAATKATSVVDLVTAAKAKANDRGPTLTSKEMDPNRHQGKGEKSDNKDAYEEEEDPMDEREDKGQGHESRETTKYEGGDASSDDDSSDDSSGSEEEESEMKKGENTRDDQEVGERKNSQSGDYSSESDSSDDHSGSEEDSEDSEAESDKGSEKEDNQQLMRKQSVPDTRDCTVILNIQQQVSVNRMESMTDSQLVNCLFSSLLTFLREQHLSSRNAHISAPILQDDGNIKARVRSDIREGLQNFVHLEAWAQTHERILIGSPIPTYMVIVHEVEVDSLNFRNRKEKSVIIRKLAEANCAIANGNSFMIKDIRLGEYVSRQKRTTLFVEFFDPVQANLALNRGICVNGKRYKRCERIEPYNKLRRCDRCQEYGHLVHSCSAPYRCGKCAEQHSTASCKSTKRKCASCGSGDHSAGGKSCPARAQARKNLEFEIEHAPCVTKSAAEAQVLPSLRVRSSNSAARAQTGTSIPSPVSLDDDSPENKIKSEPDQSLLEANAPEDAYPDTATLLKRIEELRKIIIARDNALQAGSSGGTKRRADEAFADGAEAESSTVATKRIKQERDDSMGLYRQPSPYIVHRPE